MILLINPDQESLIVVVEDTTSLRPVSLETSGLEILVATLEKEVISDELFLLSFSHGSKRVVFTGKLTLELVQSRDNEVLNLLSLLS